MSRLPRAAFRDFPDSKVVYIAPLKALVRERVHDWRTRLTTQMGKKLIELTGDVTPDIKTIQDADIIIVRISLLWQNVTVELDHTREMGRCKSELAVSNLC